jgi:type VII secretion protein EccB
MASRRDQLQSYQFLTQRVISAFVMRETDPAQSPLRRGIGAVFAGLMIAVVVAAGFGIYGLLTKIGNGNWKTDGTVVVEKETGASYVYQSGLLYPAINYTSALLAAGQPTPHVMRVSSNSLNGVPRHSMIGIPGAPNSLPGSGSTVKGAWTLCSTDGTGTPETELVIAGGPSGGQKLSGGPDGQGLLVISGAETYLVWNGRRYLVRSASVSVKSLFGLSVTAAPVGAAWLDGLPQGVDIVAPSPPQTGQRSTAVQYTIGDVLMAQNGTGKQYYLVYDDGLAALTELQFDLLRGKNPTEPTTIPLAVANDSPVSKQLSTPPPDVRPPDRPPSLPAQPTASTDPVCAQSTDPHAFPSVSVGGSLAAVGTGAPTASQSEQGAPLANSVALTPGRVAIVQAIASPTATTGAYYIVTDIGVRYPVASADVLKILGFQPEQAQDEPANFVSRIPTGPTLDPLAAVRPVNPSNVGGN